MKMLLNNGSVIANAPDMTEKVREYLNQFWHFPSKEEMEKEKEKYYVVDCKREFLRRKDIIEHEISI
jgi:hypothetical protein